MLKFEILTGENMTSLVNALSLLGHGDDIRETVSFFLPTVDDGCEVGFARVGDTLLVRIFDEGEYIFIYPIALSDGADEREALFELRGYASREEIPLVLYDVPREAVPTLDEAFRYTKITECEDQLIAEVLSELSMFPETPVLTDGVISLTPLMEEDIPRYAEISKNEEINRFWGYDYREDNPDPEDEYFYLEANRGYEEGTSLTLGVRYEGELIGEGCIWGFDLIGGAEIGFRILPEWQGKGLGRRTLMLLIGLGEELGLLNLYATVKKENTPSLGLLQSVMEKYAERNDVNKYIHKY